MPAEHTESADPSTVPPPPSDAPLTFFFSDVEGSTRLAGSLGASFAAVLEGHRRIVRAVFASHGGAEISTGGDSFFAVFASPLEAIRAAADIQRGLEAPLDDKGTRIRVRIGLHAGHAVRVGGDFLGLDVNRAARIADAGHGGQVLVSDPVRLAVADALEGIGLRDLGRHRLKDVGPERLWQLEGDGLDPGPFPPPRSLEAHPTNLPAELAPLIGRGRELAEASDLVRAASVVTIVGAAGVGKSRLAVAVGRELVMGFPDGVFYLDLTSTATAEEVAAELGELLGVRSPVDVTAALLERLRDRDLLLVLDTADRVEGLGALVARIVATCPRIRVLVTSRAPLHIGAEHPYTLRPLATADAVALFEARARLVRPGLTLDATARHAVGALVDRLDRIPLAVELAAARSRLLAPAAILDRLERRLPALGEGARDVPARQRTLEAAIAWSCDLLSPPEAGFFARLGVFAGWFDVASVEAVAGAPDGADPLELLERLVDRSLVSTDPSSQEPRFRLLGPIATFALDALRARGEEESTRARHAGHFMAVAAERAAQLEGPEDIAAVSAIRAVDPEIKAALGWALSGAPATPEADEAAAGRDRRLLGLELAASQGRYWWLRGRVHEGVAWLARALAATPDADAPTRARALYWAGVLSDDARRPEDAERYLLAALEIQRERGDERAAARTLNSLGVVARSRGDWDRAERLLAESLERKRAIGDLAGVGVSVSNLGVLASDRGDHDRAAELLEEALSIDEEIGAVSSVTVSCANLGAELVRAGRVERGLAQLRRALPGIEELEDPELVAAMLTSLAHVRLHGPAADAPDGRAADPDAEAAARLVLAGEALRDREGIPLRATERIEVDELLAAIGRRLAPSILEALRAETSSIDAPAALALVKAEVEAARVG